MAKLKKKMTCHIRNYVVCKQAMSGLRESLKLYKETCSIEKVCTRGSQKMKPLALFVYTPDDCEEVDFGGVQLFE